jgi:cobalt-zinc-cadmium efflux system protein
MSHHAHHAHAESAGSRFLIQAFTLASLLLLIEVVGGLAAHSLGLLGDAGHLLTDVLALGASVFSARLARRPAQGRWSYGFSRAGILAALFNASTLLLVSGAIVIEAIGRFLHPVAVQGTIVWIVALIGLVGNLYIGLRLGGGQHDENLNVRSAWLHVMTDAAASGSVLVAGVVIALTGWRLADPIASLIVSLLIVRFAWGILQETVAILMEATPKGLDLEALCEAIGSDKAVRSCHHLHVWSLGSGETALSAHLVLHEMPLVETKDVISRASAVLRDRFGIAHCTFQVESQDGPCDDGDCAS